MEEKCSSVDLFHTILLAGLIRKLGLFDAVTR